MSKFFSAILLIPLFFLILIYFIGAAIMRADFNEFEEYRLQKVNNYATDAAVDELLYSDDLKQDYKDISKVTVDPLRARDMYLRILASNYDIPTTRDNLENLSAQYLDLMVVVGYDGYYILTNDATAELSNGVTTDTYKVESSMKFPYVYRDANDKLYSYDLGFEKALLLGSRSIDSVDCPISKSKGLSLINQTINQEVNNRLAVKVDGGLLKSINIPVEATSIGKVSNNIESISVLSFLNGVNFNTSKEMTAFSLGGAKVEPVRQVACYKRRDTSGNYKKFYCYVDLIPSTVANPARIESWADYVVNSMEEAAAKGYSCDYELMIGGVS